MAYVSEALPIVMSMTWILTVKTISGAKGDEHKLRFGTEAEAQAALDETMAVMGTVGSKPVKIAGKLVVVGSQVTSAEIRQTSSGSIGIA